MNLIEKAVRFALDAHEGSLRKGTDLPYILHPLEAAAVAARLTDDPEVIAAVVLHDVAEDTKYSLEDIQEVFGSRVADLVGSNTENKRRELPAEDTWTVRKRETIEHLKTASRDEKIVAFSDKLSNLRSMVADYIKEGEAFWQRFKVTDPNKHVWYYGGMLESFEEFGGTFLFSEYRRLYGMLRMRVQEFEDTGRHDPDPLAVVATPDSGYWVLRSEKTDEILLMTQEELEELVQNRSQEREEDEV